MSKKKSKTSDQAEVAKKAKSKAKAAPAAEAAPAATAAAEPVPVETTREAATEKSTSSDGIPATLDTSEFAAAWAEWLKFTEDRGIGLEAHDKARQLDLLAKMSPEAAIADIRKTMQDHPLKDRVPAAGASSSGRAKKERQAKKMSALDAAAKVLEEAGGSMTTQEMIEAMAKKGYWSSPGGLTPAATLYSAILRETNNKGAAARFKKTVMWSTT